MASIIKYEDGTYRLSLTEDDYHALGTALQSAHWEGEGEGPHVLSLDFWKEYLNVGSVDIDSDWPFKYTSVDGDGITPYVEITENEEYEEE